MIKLNLGQLFAKLNLKKVYGKAFVPIYIVDYSLLDEDVLFKEEYKDVGMWFSTSGERWMCHSELSPEAFKDYILTNVTVKHIEKIRFYKDFIPFSTNTEIPF